MDDVQAICIARFYRLLVNALGRDPTREEEDKKVIVNAWQTYNHRFFEHAGSPSQGLRTCAYAATELTEPVMIAPDMHGRASVVLPEADGYAHQFAYAVLPKWRYAELLATAGYDDLPKPQQQFEAGPVPHVLATVDRTAPVLPPALLPLGWVGDLVWWKKNDGTLEAGTQEKPPAALQRLGSSAGSSMAMLLPHHAERRLSRTNTPTQRNLEHAGELSTGIGTLSDPDWCTALLGALPVEPMVSVGPRPDDQDPDVVSRLAHQTESLWPRERKRVRLVSFMPHWYRHIAVAAEGAGVDVSAVAMTYLPEAASGLLQINRVNGNAKLVPGHPWTGRTEYDGGSPEFSATVVGDGKPVHARFELDVPLLRYRDTTDEVTARLWDGVVAQLPDPGVAYQIDLDAPPRLGEPRRSITPLARILRSSTPGIATFDVFAVSRDWALTSAVREEQGQRILKLTLSPLGTGLPVPKDAMSDALVGFVPDDDGALRVPGGWTLDWLGELLRHFPAAAAAVRLDWAAQLWRELRVRDIGVLEDGSNFFTSLPALQLMHLNVRRPANEAETAALRAALEAWAQGCQNSVAGRHIAQFAIDAIGSVFSGPAATAELDVPWILDTMPLPNSPLIAIDSIGGIRYMLPELMTPEGTRELGTNGNDIARAVALWQSQKAKAFAGRRLVITAQRGDNVALPLRPILIN